MGTWNETPLSKITLPVGDWSFPIHSVKVGISPNNGKAQVVLLLESDSRVGEVSIPLEPWASAPDDVAMFERIFKSQALGLGFVPSDGMLENAKLAGEFANYVEGLEGEIVVVRVTHKTSKDLKDNGTPYINHVVSFLRLAGVPATA